MTIQKNNSSIYGIFTNHNDEKLAYYPCPKNANSSAKLFFAKHLKIEDKFLFLGDEKPRYLQDKSVYFKENKTPLSNWLPSKQKFSAVQSDIKCCIVRDPVKRFISAYKNRIVYHRDRQFFNHTVDQIIDRLEKNDFENKHFLPQNYFLGDDLNYYNCVGNVENILKFRDFINNFFERKLDFPKIQKGGRETNLKLTNNQESRIRKIYESDYKLLNKIYKY